MSKISTYEVVPVPKLADKLIGTSVGGEIEDATYNFTLQELLELFLPNIPANNLQGVLDYGNTATQDINLFGTITTTNLDVTDTANLFITYLNEETHIVGGVYDSEDSIGTSGQVLTSTGEGVAWVTLPPIFTPNLQQVLTEGNTSTIGIVLDATLEALNVDTDDAVINTNITIDGTITDGFSAVGNSGQVLSSTSSGVKWVNLPAYSAVSPLLFNSVTGVFSIQQASNVQAGFLSANDWINFNGKQPAGNYITALTGEATASGPGGANTVLSNSAVINKVLTGFNPLSGIINPSDTILTAFGKTQSQINALVGGVQYKGTWNALTNTPTLQSSVGVQGNYYIVNVAGTTNLNGITDWQVGDWAIFSESTWQKVDNTDAVTSVNGFTGAVSLITDDIPEGVTNLYYLDSRARGALSFAAGSGAYNNVTGVITIPTNNNQILNGAGYITLASLSASAPLSYNNLTGGFAIQKSDATHDGYLSSTDWSTFNNKQNYLGGTGLVKSTAGTITYITDNSGNWNTAYDRSIVSAAVTGTSTKTLTLTEQDGNTIQASWTDLDTGLTSVGVSMPSAFTVTNSPLTANGTIGITGAGTSLQYIDGTGALQNFPGLTGFIPYTGATQNVNLGEYGISAGYFQADLTPTNALQVGRMQWNATDGTMDLRLLGNNVTLQIGEENVTRVVNKSGIDLLEANYQVVRLRKVAEGGAQGQRLAVVLAQGNNENNSTEVLGLVTETINANQEGFITCFGEVKEIDTTGSLQGETWVDGDILYLSATVAGQLTNIRPVAPNHAVIVGYVSYAHAVHGKIYMAIDTGYELGELHNVYAPSPTANESIYWNVANSRYELNTISGILGYTPASAATTITINGTTYDLSANRTWSVGTVTSVAALTIGTAGTDLSSTVTNGTTTPVITLNVPTASASNRGALSAADWATFNSKVGGVTASSPLASSGGSTPNITIQVANGSQNGYLSSTDWTTFNNKQASGNYITSLTGEATASGPGAASVTLNNAAVTGKVLTGINITGGTVLATDSILTGFGKLQNQINGLIGSTIYQGTWNASTNTPTLTSSVGTRGYYYIVNVAGNTNLNGITDWQVGDWAIYDGTAWQKVDNTDAVSSVNGQTGAVSLTTDNIPEGSTNLYFTNARSRAALSFVAGSGAYNSTTGAITIPTNTNQLTNGASFITLTSLSASSPLSYNNTTGDFSIQVANASQSGYLSSTDWNTFNNKQVAGNYVTTDTTQTITALKTFTAKVTINTGGTDDQLQLVGTAPSVRLSNAVTGATINGFIAMAGAANNYIQGAVAGDMCIGNQNNGKIIYGFGSGTATPKMSLDSSGNVDFSGGLTLGGNITKGAFTYTLPSASGTLALTSQLPAAPAFSGANINMPIVIQSGGTLYYTNSYINPSTNAMSLAGPLYGTFANFANSGWASTNSTVNRYINIGLGGTADYIQSVILLHPVYNGTLIAYNMCSGTIYQTRGGTGQGSIYNSYKIDTQSAYNGTYGSLESLNNVGQLITCTYGGVKYLALLPNYYTSAVNFTFDGFIQSSNSVSLQIVEYRNSQTGAILNSEVNSSIANYSTNMSTTFSGNINALGSLGVGTSSPIFQADILASSYKTLRVQSNDDVVMTFGSTIASSQYWSMTATSNGSGQGSNVFFIGRSTSNPSGLLTKDFTLSSTGAATFSNSITATTGFFNGFAINGTPSSTGTSQNFIEFRNTGGDFYIGKEGSVAGGFFPGSSAYDNVFYSDRPYNFIIGGSSRFSITTSGVGVSGFLSVGSVTYMSSTLYYNVGDGNDWYISGLANGPTIRMRYHGGSTNRNAALAWVDNGGNRSDILQWTDGQLTARVTQLMYDTTTVYYASSLNRSSTIGMIDGANMYINSSPAGNLYIGGGTTTYINGAMSVNNSVTATGFFESSDSRLKTIVEEAYNSNAIFNVKPKTYVKEGKKEVGYFAQDFEELLLSAVSKNDAGYLSLSYTQVHTIKISIIEDEVTLLKKKVSDLESKLLKYES